MVVPLVGRLDKQVFVKCMVFNGTMGVSAISVIQLKTSLLNKPIVDS